MALGTGPARPDSAAMAEGTALAPADSAAMAEDSSAIDVNLFEEGDNRDLQKYSRRGQLTLSDERARCRSAQGYP